MLIFTKTHPDILYLIFCAYRYVPIDVDHISHKTICHMIIYKLHVQNRSLRLPQYNNFFSSIPCLACVILDTRLQPNSRTVDEFTPLEQLSPVCSIICFG